MRTNRKAMSESTQAFYLRLNNHKRFMTGALSELYQNETLVDCMLTAQGGQLRAHRTILAACSPYFKEIFTQCQTSQYPVVIIKDMPFADLKAIVDYIYRGEVTIPRRQLQSILNSGTTLQVKGLLEFNRKKCSNIIDSDDTCAEDEYESDNDIDDNESIHDKNGIKYLGNNSVKACESNGNIRSNKKRTRKSRNSKEKCSNGCDRESENFGKTLPLSDVKIDDNNICTNDEITNNNDNIKDNIKREYSETENQIKLMNGKERVVKTSDESSETSLESALINTNGGEHNMEKSMTVKTVEKTACAGEDNIVPLMPFAPLQQSAMIDVKPSVNQASHSSEFSSGLATSSGTETIATTIGAGAVYSDMNSMTDIKTIVNLEKQNQSQNESNFKINDKNICANNSHIINEFHNIPALKVINESASDVNQTQSSIQNKSLKSATDEEQKRLKNKNKTSKESKSGQKVVLTNRKSFECPFCHKLYVSPQNMREHLRNTHTNPEQKYVCSVCQKKYSWKHALDRHFKSKHTAN